MPASLRPDIASTRGQARIGLAFHILLRKPQPTAPAARGTVTEIEPHVLREFLDGLVSNLMSAWQQSGISLCMGSVATIEQVR